MCVNAAAVPSLPSSAEGLVNIDADILFAKNCCAVVYAFGRSILNSIRDQQLLIKAEKMYRYVGLFV
jgi:hypothetical protein